jgi:molybdopterin/thiamine biosynthesis adenylyltransferase
MTPWFLRDAERLKIERAGVESLARTVNWLMGTEWLFDNNLCLDAVIRAHGHDYEVRVKFPPLYPNAPASVFPRNVDRRLTYHQYGGKDGPLCLQWGPDNWHNSVTAVQLLESTHQLLETENPFGEDRPEIPTAAPSRHLLTVGQGLRGSWARWYLSNEFKVFLASQPKSTVGSFKFSVRKTSENLIGLIHEASPMMGDAWKDSQVPSNLPKAEIDDRDNGVWFITDIASSKVRAANSLADVHALLADYDGAKYIAVDGSSPIAGLERPIIGVVIQDQSGEPHLFVLLSNETIIPCSMVQSDSVPEHFREPDGSSLSNKTIGVVGLGSAGSMIAVSLARMGVRQFCLVDYDVILPENLRRHALDWQSVGLHKVDALSDAISRIQASARVTVSRLHLSGQESNAAVSGVLERLAGCDLLIDATANPKAFNLLSAISKAASKPLVWLEVYGGGLGGMVARSRPGIDPLPQDMRSAYLQYCTSNPMLEPLNPAQRYAIEAADGEVLVASDADIAVIAHHAARFVPDTFKSAEDTAFPYSMYLVGLAKGWVFEAPFFTIPVSMERFPVSGWGDDAGKGLDEESVAFLIGLFKKDKDEAPGTS